VALALQGGQFFLADEARYTRGVAIYQALRTGDAAGLREELKWPEHAGFNFLNTAVAALQHALAQLTASGDWSQPQNIFASAPLCSDCSPCSTSGWCTGSHGPPAPARPRPCGRPCSWRRPTRSSITRATCSPMTARSPPRWVRSSSP
jgi:hypothetical protein